MNVRLHVPGCVAVGLFVAGMAAGAGVRDALDPARVAPHIYMPRFENERVRVLEVTVRNGEQAPLHTHPDHLLVFVGVCAWLEVTGDGKQRMQSYNAGDVVWEPGMMHGGEPNNVIHDCRQLAIELKENERSGE